MSQVANKSVLVGDAYAFFNLFSVERLKSNVNETVKIYREDNAATMWFTPEQIKDGTCSTFLNGNHGLVTELAQQGVASANAVQTDPTKMPKLFDSGTLLTDSTNGLPLITHTGAEYMEYAEGTIIPASSDDTTPYQISTFTLATPSNVGNNPDNAGIFSELCSTVTYAGLVKGGGLGTRWAMYAKLGGSSFAASGRDNLYDQPVLFSMCADPSASPSSFIRYDKTLLSTHTQVTLNRVHSNKGFLGVRIDQSNYFGFIGGLQMHGTFRTDVRNEHDAICDNINAQIQAF